MQTHSRRRAALLTAIAALCAIGASAALRAQSDTSPAPEDPRIFRGAMGIPCEQHRLSFEGDPDGTAVIKKVFVKPGDLVKAGDPLLMEDTSLTEAQLAGDKAAAEATGAIDEGDATVKAKSKLLDFYSKLSRGNLSGKETIDAQMDLDVAVARKKQAEEQHDERQKVYERDQVKLQHMTLKSPIDGIVESINLFEGEAVDASSEKDGACFVVSIDPLWIEFHLDAVKAGRLALHDPVEVAFPAQPNQWIKGEVIFLDPSVAFVNQTRTVRVSIANPQHQPAGLPMIVRLPAKVLDESGAVGSAQP